jgi:RND family efflux transporter MFP subunit
MAREGDGPPGSREGSGSRDAGLPVNIGLANESGFPHAGKLDFVDNQLNPQTGTIRARAVLQNKDGQFTPGLFARVQLLGSGEYSAILIDDRAVNTDQSQKYVYVVNAKNEIEYRKVTLGRVIDGLRVVRDGLKAGDVIVVNGAQRVHPGVTVNAEKVPMGGDAAQAAK